MVISFFPYTIDITDKLSKTIEQIVNNTMRNLDRMTSTQAPISGDHLDLTIESLGRMAPGTGNPAVKNNSVWVWLEDPADQVMVAALLVLGRKECPLRPLGSVYCRFL